MNGYILLLSGLFPGDWERFRFPALFLFFRMIWYPAGLRMAFLSAGRYPVRREKLADYLIV